MFLLMFTRQTKENEAQSLSDRGNSLRGTSHVNVCISVFIYVEPVSRSKDYVRP